MLPFGINKIVEEYCCYRKPYLKSLENETLQIRSVIDNTESKDLSYQIRVETVELPSFAKFSIIKIDGKFCIGDFFASPSKILSTNNSRYKMNEQRMSMNLYPNTGNFGNDIRRENSIQIYDFQACNKCWIGY